MSADVRELLLQRMAEDLIGPAAPDEVLTDRPADRYLTGILYPQRYPVGPDQDESLEMQDADDEEPIGGEPDSVGLASTMRPASAGISFAAVGGSSHAPVVSIRISCGTYKAIVDEEGDEVSSERDPAGPGREERESVGKNKVRWQRTDHSVELPDLALDFQHHAVDLADHGIPGLSLYLQTAPWDSGRIVTAVLLNTREIADEDRPRDIQEKTFFQTRLEIVPSSGTRIPARPSRRVAVDEDGQAAALLYRNVREFAVGHTCSAEWESPDGLHATSVATTWLPQAIVPAISSSGDMEFAALMASSDLQPLSAEWLSVSTGPELEKGLRLLPEAYEQWIQRQSLRLPELPENLQPQARKHLDECRAAMLRMLDAVDLITRDKQVRIAFQLANRAMLIQRGWAHPDEAPLTWRPFQLGFLLLALPSIANREHPDREIMDLLWFPTGGGKTEAYLALVAFTMIHRRLRHPATPDRGAGVAALMRYTLRLLTTQQFQRATALVMACELLRRGHRLPEGTRPDLGVQPFSIGLWVGGTAVANNIQEAVRALRERRPNTPTQIERCPACSKKLRWNAAPDATSIHVSCTNSECDLGRVVRHLPIWTVDEDVYREKPSLIVGTVDKFAQITRTFETRSLFGLDADVDAPDLIVQDELHLISGPLGTMAGIYEIAIDIFCSQDGFAPKVIGSTATIRRAEDQIRALFDRRTRQFPPPGLDASNSGFAVEDPNSPGRLYVGLTTAGRSAKFTLQAVSASLLQSASTPSLTDEQRDPYWTLVVYFNSLRELGGALVLMQDDVGDSIAAYARRRNEPPRLAQITEELTSRVSQLEIRDKLEELTNTAGDPSAIDVLLASNMISVGVDIPRLGLMVVNGQPKGIAEYIQATSRVGRGKVPGLVVTIYNNAKARDRSHYESFSTWHRSLYRDVEATSVTPFSSRARDRALHAILVALIRHLVPEMNTTPILTEAGESAARTFAEWIIARAERIDKDEVPRLRLQLEAIVANWKNRYGLKTYWNDRKRSSSLLISAERAAALRATGRLPGQAWPTPNSMRNVEPGTPFSLVERLRTEEELDDVAE